MIKIVVPISGGKDSQACLKLALQSYDKSEVLGLFCDTKFEHPLTYTHIDKMREIYGVEIRVVNNGSVEEKVLKYKRFPGGGARHCTDELKIKVSKKFYGDFALEQGGFEVWCGMRSNESSARKKRYNGKTNDELYKPNDVLAKYPKYLHERGVSFRLPVLDWSTSEIFELLADEENPLYSHGFERVGCFPCLASGDKWKEKAFSFDETGRKHFKLVQELEKKINYSIWSSKGGKKRNNEDREDIFTGCAICAI